MENSLVDSGHHGESLVRLMVPLFTLRRRHVADRLEAPPIVEPIHSFEWRSAARLAV